MMSMSDITVKDIHIAGDDDTGYQVVVREHCQTETFPTKEEAYEDYIATLIRGIENARDWLAIQTY